MWSSLCFWTCFFALFCGSSVEGWTVSSVCKRHPHSTHVVVAPLYSRARQRRVPVEPSDYWNAATSSSTTYNSNYLDADDEEDSFATFDDDLPQLEACPTEAGTAHVLLPPQQRLPT